MYTVNKRNVWMSSIGLSILLSGCGIAHASVVTVPTSWPTMSATLAGKSVTVRMPQSWSRYRWTRQTGEVVFTKSDNMAAVPNVTVNYEAFPQTAGISSFRLNGQYVLSEGGGYHDLWGIQVTVPKTAADRSLAHEIISTWQVGNR